MLEGETAKDGVCRILSLDGGGAKGFYTLGVLMEIEGMLRRPLHERFDLVFGTGTGAIIAALIALGHRVDEIHALYEKHVPTSRRNDRHVFRSKIYPVSHDQDLPPKLHASEMIHNT